MNNRSVHPPIRTLEALSLDHPNLRRLDNQVEVAFFNLGSQDVIHVELVFKSGLSKSVNNVIPTAVSELLGSSSLKYSSGEIAEKIDCIAFAPDVQQVLDRATQADKNSGAVQLNLPIDAQRRIVQGIQAAAEQFPYAHILCPHFTRGSLRRMAERSLKRPPVFISAKEIQHSVDINRVALITMKGIKLVS